MRVRELGVRQAPSVFQRLFRIQGGQAPETIRRIERPYWMERGWVREGTHYSGNYQTLYGSFTGYVEEQASNAFDFYILNPPEALQRHSHWTCFQHRGDNWFHIHMGRKPKDLSSGILTIERLITEAFEG